jgi:hypothetical protein
VIKLQADGNEIWSKTFGEGKMLILNSIAPTRDGGYITAASFKSASQPLERYDGWVLKLDASGNSAWSRRFGGTEEDELPSLALTSDGGYVTAGWTWSFGAGAGDGWVIKMDANGNTGPNPPLSKGNTSGHSPIPPLLPGKPPFGRP